MNTKGSSHARPDRTFSRDCVAPILVLQAAPLFLPGRSRVRKGRFFLYSIERLLFFIASSAETRRTFLDVVDRALELTVERVSFSLITLRA